MPGELVIDSLRFASQGKSLSGRRDANSLPRLRDLVSSGVGAIEFSLQGELTADGRAAIRSIISGHVELTCQRCLGVLSYPIQLERQFLLYATEQEMPDLVEEADEVDALVAASDLDVLALIEDEILLALPLSPHHDHDCITADRVASAPTGDNPFETLKALRKH
jgi:uncharacterized protein